MAEYYRIKEKSLVNLANVVRSKTGSSESLSFDRIVSEIESIDGGEKDFLEARITNQITEYSNDKISRIFNYAFAGCTNLTSINLPACSSMGASVFANCTNLTSINLPACSSMGMYTFVGCTNLTSINLPACSSVGMNAFSGCSKLISVNFPTCLSIASSAFQNCYQLTDISFPACKSIANSAFYRCSSLTSVCFPECTDTVASTFASCINLISVSFPLLKYVGNFDYLNCTKLTNLEFPKCTKIGSGAFTGCSKLVSVSFPVCSIVGVGAFKNCTMLTSINFPMAINLSSSAFNGCTNLSTIIIGNSTVCSVRNSNAFTGTPIASGTGIIYVPASLVDTYKSSSVWSIYSNIIKSVDRVEISDIKDKTLLFEESKQLYISITRGGDAQNYDTIATITSTDESIVQISNINVDNDLITFTATAQQVEGSAIINISVTCGDYSDSVSMMLKVLESMPEATYEVQSVGASYEFELNADGYYESENKNVNGSSATCKLVFNTQGIYNLYLDCINDSGSENTYDYGLISKVDKTLNLGNSDNEENIFKSFKGLSSSSIQTVDLGVVEAGEHFIYIKFMKDGFTHDGNDSLQFKVRMEA